MASDSQLFAWSSPSRAIAFAEALAGVMIRPEEEGSRNSDSERLNAVLLVLKEFSPVQEAALWKLKSRAGYASCIVRSAPAASGTSNERENNAPLVAPIEDFWPLNSLIESPVKCADFIKVTDLWERHGHREIIVKLAFGRICGPATPTDNVPNFLLELKYPADGGRTDIPLPILGAIRSKITSGVCALIDKRLNLITNEMSHISLADASAGAEYAIDKTISRVIPKYIQCERMIRLTQTDSGSFVLTRDSDLVRGIENPLSGISRGSIDVLVDALESSSKDDPSNAEDAVLLVERDVSRMLIGEDFADFRNVLSVRIDNRSNEEQRASYIILVNRLNDLSIQNSANAQADHFDWEDEKYLSHIALTITFIRELFSAEEARLRRAHILAHELHAPTAFIFGTIERVRNAVLGTSAMPIGMFRRELNDVLDANDLQTALIDGLMLGFQSSSESPGLKYNPEWVDMSEIADKVVRMLMPICRKHKVPHSGIQVRKLPKIYMDRRAITQILLNVATNAIKYSGSNRSKFSLLIYHEHISTSDLTVTRAPKSLISLLTRLGVGGGELIMFEDEGIGVPPGFADKLFRLGSRADDPEVLSKAGAGIGLSIVRSIMRDHLGDVWLERFSRPTQFALFVPDLVATGEYINLVEWSGEPE